MKKNNQTKFRHCDPIFGMQKLLYAQLKNAMQFDTFHPLRQQMQCGDSTKNMRKELVANNLRITEATSPKLFALIEEVKQRLDFKEPVEFYYDSDTRVNASSFLSDDEKIPNFICISAGMINLLSDRELQCVIGHELGHCITRGIELRRLYLYLYPANDEGKRNAPEYLKDRMRAAGLCNEFISDFYGYIACQDLNTTVSALCKTASGISFDEGINVEALLNEVCESVQFMADNNVKDEGSHPHIPSRIMAVKLFAESQSQREFEMGMASILKNVAALEYDADDTALATFATAYGLQMQGDPDFICGLIAPLTFAPGAVLKKAQKTNFAWLQKRLPSLLKKHHINPEQFMLLVISILAHSSRITSEDVARLIDLGNRLHLDEEEVRLNLMAVLKDNYIIPASRLVA